MTRYTLDVLGCCAFGLEFNTLKDSNSLFRNMAKIITDFSGLRNTIRFCILQVLSPTLIKWFDIKQTTAEAENFFFDLLHNAEQLRRRETGWHRGDFLQLMLDIRDDEENKASREYVFMILSRHHYSDEIYQ